MKTGKLALLGTTILAILSSNNLKAEEQEGYAPRSITYRTKKVLEDKKYECHYQGYERIVKPITIAQGQLPEYADKYKFLRNSIMYVVISDEMEKRGSIVETDCDDQGNPFNNSSEIGEIVSYTPSDLEEENGNYLQELKELVAKKEIQTSPVTLSYEEYTDPLIFDCRDEQEQIFKDLETNGSDTVKSNIARLSGVIIEVYRNANDNGKANSFVPSSVRKPTYKESDRNRGTQLVITVVATPSNGNQCTLSTSTEIEAVVSRN